MTTKRKPTKPTKRKPTKPTKRKPTKPTKRKPTKRKRKSGAVRSPRGRFVKAGTVWTRRDGRKVALADMDDRHLSQVTGMLVRRGMTNEGVRAEIDERSALEPLDDLPVDERRALRWEREREYLSANHVDLHGIDGLDPDDDVLTEVDLDDADVYGPEQ